MSSKGKRKSSPSIKEGRKKRRKTINLDLKMKIIKAHDEGKKVNLIAQEEGLAHSTISTILKDKERIKKAIKGASGTDAIITRHRTGLIHETEKLLLLWIEDRIQKRMPISLSLIQAKARSIFATLKDRAGQECTEVFTASRGWFMRFQRRFNYRSTRKSRKSASVDEAARHFLDELDDVIAKGSYLPEQIFNVEETWLFWKKMPEQTYIHKEAKAMPGYKTFKERVTLLLGGNVSGFKLKPFLVHKSGNHRLLKNICKRTLPIYYRSNPKAWMTPVLFEDWCMNCFIPQVKEYCLQKKIPFKILLLLDNGPGHPPQLHNIYPDVKVVYLPKNTTPFLQPMDQGAITIFKAYYLRAMFAKAVDVMKEDKRATLREFWKNYNILHCIKNIGAAWQDVTVKCMQGIWKKSLKCFPVLINNFQGFDHHKDLDEINKEILTLVKSLDLEASAEDVKSLIAYTEGELSNEDLIELKEELEARRVKEEEEEEDDDDDEEEEEEDEEEEDEEEDEEEEEEEEPEEEPGEEEEPQEEKPKEEEEGEEEPEEQPEEEKGGNVEIQPKKFNVKALARVFSGINQTLSKLQSMDPNVKHFGKVYQDMHKILKCYHEIYEEKKKTCANQN